MCLYVLPPFCKQDSIGVYTCQQYFCGSSSGSAPLRIYGRDLRLYVQNPDADLQANQRPEPGRAVLTARAYNLGGFRLEPKPQKRCSLHTGHVKPVDFLSLALRKPHKFYTACGKLRDLFSVGEERRLRVTVGGVIVIYKKT